MRALFLISGICACLAGPAAHADGPAQLRVSSHPQNGAYLTNGRGLALYAFSRDIPGTEGANAAVNCRGTCLQIWSPLLSPARPATGRALDSALAGTAPLEGKTIATYAGRPLYTYLVDNEAGDIAGHGMESFNGVWHLLSPKGELISVE